MSLLDVYWLWRDMNSGEEPMEVGILVSQVAVLEDVDSHSGSGQLYGEPLQLNQQPTSTEKK